MVLHNRLRARYRQTMLDPDFDPVRPPSKSGDAAFHTAHYARERGRRPARCPASVFRKRSWHQHARADEHPRKAQGGPRRHHDRLGPGAPHANRATPWRLRAVAGSDARRFSEPQAGATPNGEKAFALTVPRPCPFFSDSTGASRRMQRSLLAVGDVKFVQKAMQDRREH